jgi:DNA topoisomerase IB
VVFDYVAKSGKRRVQDVVDPDVYEILARLKRRRAGGPELLAFQERREWRDIRSADINAYVKAATGADFSAKDFRTWNATVLAAVALAVSGGVAATQTGRQKAISRAVKEVSYYLGNTPAVCRASYIDPRVFDAYRAGVVIGRVGEIATGLELGRLLIHEPRVERAVIDIVSDNAESPALAQVA